MLLYPFRGWNRKLRVIEDQFLLSAPVLTASQGAESTVWLRQLEHLKQIKM